MTDPDPGSDALKQLEDQLTKPPPEPTRGYIIVRPLPSARGDDDERMQEHLQRITRAMGLAVLGATGGDVIAAVLYRLAPPIPGQEAEDFAEHGIVYYQGAHGVEIRDGYWCVPQGRVLAYDDPPSGGEGR